MAKEEAARSNRTLISETESLIKEYINFNNITDYVSLKAMKTLAQMPNPYFRMRFELDRSAFLLRGVACRILPKRLLDGVLTKLNRIRW